MIIYKKGDLFTAPEDAILVHACNALGVWRAGVAAQFREKFTTEYISYRDFCDENGRNSVGKACLVGSVGCLITSFNFGSMVDSPPDIIKATETAIESLYLQAVGAGRSLDFHSPKTNSGLFVVPWKCTEKAIEDFLEKHHDVSWTVWRVK